MRFEAAVLALLLAVPPAAGQDQPAAERPRVAPEEVPAPKRKKFIAPEYPAEAVAQGLRGIVILKLVIDTEGKVASADVMRSVPPFDEAALAAVRQWEYEVTKVDGKPVPVLVTLPITFSLRLPDLKREAGIPELRSGAAPQVPAAGAGRTVKVTAEVTLAPDGRIADASVTSGELPWSEALLLALRTWRFMPPGDRTTVSFRVDAEFVASGNTAPRVNLYLGGLREAESSVAADSATTAPEAPAPAAANPAEPVAAPLASPAPDASQPVAPAPEAPAPSPSPAAAAPEPAAAAQVPPPVRPAPSAPSPAPPAKDDVSTAQAAPRPAPTPPPVEVIPGAPMAAPPGPPETGISAVRDVSLAEGVPDLASGRRPVVPPLARMDGLGGRVEVRFSVDAAGAVSGVSAEGPDLLKDAARATVSSWSFRRARPERLRLVAVMEYQGDAATASVKRQE